ncbi:MAG: PaaI family thioesterase [Solirubrobacterales bacterium]
MADPHSDAAQKAKDGLPALLGIEFFESGPELARGRIEVSERVLQPYGIVHGGVYAALAESICSWATDRAVAADGMAAIGQANQATFLRPISSGHVNAEATARHRGRTTWVWDCEVRDDDERLCALVRMTIAVRPRPPR